MIFRAMWTSLVGKKIELGLLAALVVASAPLRAAQEPLGPGTLGAGERIMPPPCAPAEALEPGELERLYRFAAVPNGFEEWQRRDCYPRHVDTAVLTRLSHPTGVIVTVLGRDIWVVELGTDWLSQCAGFGLFSAGPDEVTGSDLAALLAAIAANPDLGSEDLREIGLAKGRKRGSGSLYALYAASVRRAVRVQCFEDLPPMVAKAAEALRAAR